MATDDDLRVLDTELTRVVDRLNAMPLARAATAWETCYAAAELILDSTRALTDDIPSGAVLPRLAPQGLGSLIAVLGHDYGEAAKAAPPADVSPVVGRLIDLRRSLP